MAKLSGKQLNKMEKMMVTARAKAVKEVIREQRIMLLFRMKAHISRVVIQIPNCTGSLIVPCSMKQG